MPEIEFNRSRVQKCSREISFNPDDPEDVRNAASVTIHVIENKHRSTDTEWINQAVAHTMREDGPYSELTKNERQRVSTIVLDYFSVPGATDSINTDLLEKTFADKCGATGLIPRRSAELMARHPEIAREFMDTAGSESYGDGASAAGYTAKDIKTLAGDKLSHLGVYNYLVYLKDDPDEAIRNLKAGLPVK